MNINETGSRGALQTEPSPRGGLTSAVGPPGRRCFNCQQADLVEGHAICRECAANPFVTERYRIHLAGRAEEEKFIDTYHNRAFNNFPEINSGQMYDFEVKYHRTWIDNDRTTANRLKETLKLVPPTTDLSVLDLGFGYGHLLTSLDRRGYGHLCGVDISEAAVNDLEARVPRGRFKTGHASSIPFDDGSFDLVLATEILEHVPVEMTFRVFDEIKRVLKQGGALIVTVPLGENLETNTFLCPHGALVNASGHVRMYDAEVLSLELRRAGFEIDTLKYLHPYLGGKLKPVKHILKMFGYVRPCGLIVMAGKQR